MRAAHLVVLILALALTTALVSVQVSGPPRARGAASSPQGTRATLLLKNGHVLSGDVLKERTDAIVMDLGFTIVSVPLEDIQERCNVKAPSAAPTDKTPGQIYTETGSRPLAERPVKDLAEELGASVAMVTTSAGLGSAFAVDNQGHFVTNYHVIQGEQEISVTLFRKGGAESDRVRIDKAQIVALNPFLDLALLRVKLPEGIAVKGLPLGSSDTLRDGQGVFAIGSPLGLERSVSEGIIGTTRRNFDGQLFLQTTAPINPGNSGGPLLNLRGEVVGVTNMKAGLFSEGLSFAIPVDTLKQFLRNRDVMAFDRDNPNNGYHYLPPPRTPAGAGGARAAEAR